VIEEEAVEVRKTLSKVDRNRWKRFTDGFMFQKE
jgi:hypothetical protein